MSSKEIKIALKEIREAIKNKEFPIAIKKCSEVLREDSKNYMALVLMGAAYQESDKKEAAKYLRRAVESAGSNKVEPTFALQGLVNCAEIDELPEMFRKLLRLVPDKSIDYHSKIALVADNAKNLESCIEMLKEETESKDEARSKSAWKSLAKILIKLNEIPEKWQILFRPALLAAIEDTESPLHLDFMKRLLKQLYKLKELDNCLKYSCLFVEKYPNEMYALEWICKIYSEEKMNFEDNLKESIEFYVEKLLTLSKENSISAIYVKALLYYNTNDFVSARETLIHIKDKSKLAKKLLVMCYMEIGAYKMAENIIRTVEIDSKILTKCLSHSNDPNTLNECLELLLKDDQNDVEILEQLVRTSFKLDNKKILSQTLEQMKSKNYFEKFMILQAEFTKTPTEALLELDKFPSNNYNIELLKGKLYLKKSNYENAMNCLVRATKMKQYRAECFENLGILHYAIKDYTRAKKLFEKDLDLNPYSNDSMKYLCGLNRQNEEWDSNLAVLKKVIKQLPLSHSSYANYQLGLHNMYNKNYDDAIHNFRTALSYDSRNILYWQLLGDSYRERGSYNSSIKAYEEVLGLKPKNNYAKLQIGCVKSILRNYNEAIECFDELLIEEPYFYPALKGAAEAHKGLAENLLPQQLLGRAKKHFQFAIDHLQKIFLADKTNMTWLWRLTANICLSVARMPKSKANLNIIGKLNGQPCEKLAVVEQKDLFELSLKFYAIALKISPEDTHLWQEIAWCAFCKAKMSCQIQKERDDCINLAIMYCKKSIMCQSNRWETWNFLGILHTVKRESQNPNYSLAQNYFIKSLSLNKRSSMTWTNLGVLYLNAGEIKLANQCFEKGQQSDPEYTSAWIGQAVIAELLADDEEALDLFRHCTQLEYNAESALGYSRWVCKIVSDDKLMNKYRYEIENMNAMPVALDSMTWYLAATENKATAESLSLYGFLNARKNLWNLAIKGFSLAAKYYKDDNIRARDEALYYLGCSYIKVGAANKAIEAFKAITETSMKSIIGIAIAYGIAKNYTESYATYISALECPNATEEEKAEILVAMSAIVYCNQGKEDTGEILYQCILLKDRPIEALYSACALGIHHGDERLAASIFDELDKWANDINQCHNVAFLTAQYLLKKGKPKQALMYLLSKVHIYPQSSQLRQVLANFIIHNFSKTKKYSKGACQVARSINDLNRHNGFRNDSVQAANSLLMASEAIKNVDKKKQLKLIQQALHLQPNNQMAWNALESCSFFFKKIC